MELIVTRADNSNYNLPSENSKITSAVQTRTLMGEDTVVMTVQSVGYINFLIGDWIEVFGRKYTLNTLGEPQRIGENTFEYNLVFEGVNYELTKVVYRSADYSGFNPTSDFPLTGTAESFLTVLQYNLDRAFGQGVWAIGSFPPTEAKTLSFTSENCLMALNRVCSEFGLEYEIKVIGGVKTINLGAVGDTLPLTLEYGKGKGLYSLTRTNVDSKNIVTRLYVEGSDRNVKAGYRDNALRLRIAANAESYIDSPSVASFGIIEGSKIFDDIFPHREGTVSAINASDVLEFTDSSMDFDLAEADSNGTKWLIAGQSAKIHFNTGALAGYEFELTSYNHTTKTFKIKPFKDERGLQFPNPDSAAFQIKTGDKYVILDIIMPDSYIQAAEAELLARAQEYLSQNDQPRVEYSLDLDRFFLKSMFSGPGFDVNFLDAGDYLHIKDSKIGVDKEVRVKTFTRDVIDPWVYQVTLSDVIEPTRIELLLADTLETKKAARQSKLFDPARTRRNWRDVEEVAGMVDTLRAEVALIGSPEGQFQVNSFFEVNKGGNPNSFGATAGVLAHDAFEGDAGSIWNIGAFDVALSNSGAYYLYAKCSKVNTGAVFTVSLTKIGVEDVPGYYHFPVGIISSVKDNARTLTTVHGYTQISGNNISTGIIKNTVSGIEINLQTGEIRGNFKFTSGASVEESIQEQQIYIQYSANGTSGWHDTFTAGDIYMRQKKGSGAWSSAIRIVGEKGADGVSITLVDVEFAKNTNPTTAPTTGWTTTAPSLAEGEQLWTRTKTTYSSGNPTYSTPANITPKTGATGQGIDSVTEEFAISSSKTVQPSTGWSTTQPEWSQGQYIWSRVKIVYKNPTSTVYTGYAVSSEWEAVNKLEVGGRNYALNTSTPKTKSSWTGANNQSLSLYVANVSPEWEVGKQVTIAFDVEVSGLAWSGGTARLAAQSYGNVTSYDGFGYKNFFSSGSESSGSGQSLKTRVVYQVTLTAAMLTNQRYTFNVRCDYITAGTVTIKNFALFYGNKATDWTPAPEDVPSALDYLATAIQDGSTDVNGGLVATNLLQVKDLNGQVRGGMSGLANDNIGFWTGGTYQEALDSLCATLFRKDGTGLLGDGRIQWDLAGLNVGDLYIDSSGAVLLKESGVLKLLITRNAIMSPEALIGGGQSYEANFTSTTNLDTGVTDVIKGTYTINNDGTEVTVTTTLSALLRLSQPHGYSTATISIIARYPSMDYVFDSYSLSASGTTEQKTGSKSVNATVILPAGTMQLVVRFENVNSVPGAPAGFNCSASAGTIDIFHSVSNPHSEIGKNGFMFGKDSYNFAYFGVDNSSKFRVILRSVGDFDIPGVLLRGTVDAAGGNSTANWWGPKKVTTRPSKSSTGRYVIYHSVGHVNYTVTAASRTANRSYHIVSKSDSQFIIEWRSIGSSPALIDTEFDFQISGLNFLAP